MKQAIEIGATGRNVAVNVRRLRMARGMSLTGLSKVAVEAGRALSRFALEMIENASVDEAKRVRRVDVDDLVALAAALGVEPQQLLMDPKDLPIEIRIGHGGAGR